MALYNPVFRGTIDGKDLYSYSVQRLDYYNKNSEYRIEKIKDILNINEDGFTDDKFWQEVFDMGLCKANLSTSDPLWSETNICKYLERLSTYIITSDRTVEEEEKIIIYDTYTEFKRALQEDKKIRQIGEVVEFESGRDSDRKPIIMLKNQRNYKKKPNPKILKEDYEKYPELLDYKAYKDYLLELMNSNELRLELLAKLKEKNPNIGYNTKEDIHKICKRQLKKVTDDMFELKNKKERPIVFKSPLRDNNANPLVEEEFIDLFDPVHVKALLSIPKNKLVFNDLDITIDSVLERLKLNEEHTITLEMWRKGFTQRAIANHLGKADNIIKRYMQIIVREFINEYEKIYEENYYYMFVCKGKWKRCSMCGEIKLTKRFRANRNASDGRRSECKICEDRRKSEIKYKKSSK